MSLDVYLEIHVDTGGPEPHHVELYWANITHNLGAMAKWAGLYDALWRPDEHGWTEAHQLIPHIRAGLERLKGSPDEARKFNPSNGWGDYEGLVEFAEGYLQACENHPKAMVRVSR